MVTAVISLVNTVVGGLLVLAGQWLIQRSEDRYYWRVGPAVADLCPGVLFALRAGLAALKVFQSTLTGDLSAYENHGMEKETKTYLSHSTAATVRQR